MLKNNIYIRFVKSWPEKEIIALYKAGGWWKETWSNVNISSIINGSFVFAVAVNSDSGKAIGMGRLISDGATDCYIQDLVVLSNYRHLGVGKQIVKHLTDYCLNKNINWIGLISEPGNEIFFQNLGFKIMKNHLPMLYQIEE